MISCNISFTMIKGMLHSVPKFLVGLPRSVSDSTIISLVIVPTDVTMSILLSVPTKAWGMRISSPMIILVITPNNLPIIILLSVPNKA